MNEFNNLVANGFGISQVDDKTLMLYCLFTMLNCQQDTYNDYNNKTLAMLKDELHKRIYECR